MASRGLLFPRSYIPYIFNTAAAVAVVPVVAGAYGILDPAAGLSVLYFPSLPRSSANDAGAQRRLSHGLLRMYAVRQVSLGLSTLAMWATGSRRALGWASLAGTLVALTDAVVARQVAEEHVAGHWVGVGLSLLFAGSFLDVL